METNIEKLKDAAKLLLEIPIDIEEIYGFPVVHHPIIKDAYQTVVVRKTKENPVGVEILDIRDGDNLEKIKKQYIELIDRCSKAIDFFMIINKPYSGLFFKLVKDFLSIEDYTDMLVDLWTIMEYPNADVNVSKTEWLSFWRKAKINYSPEDKKVIESLPDEFYVYRGLMPRAKRNALSWTLDKNRAIWFAKRFKPNGKVYRAIANKKDILAYLSNRNEDEIVIDYRKLKNMEEVEYEIGE